ncbi:uncharacterized protein LDX57_007808 [Aspergillus melleus]|uniref:uncharacterized protein n=1 Tax=Aspergillus melleus TaxID=138277 RepID=UPI001E8D1486|nr:uncharacterized protein LDX57_007808 [Aspergillus melleus]KAH8430138.1 hypothetical protein LDX57_007808 [Aspergillus melleus]
MNWFRRIWLWPRRKRVHRTASVEDQGDLHDATIGYFVTVCVGSPHRQAAVEDSSLMGDDTQKAAVENSRCERCHGRRSTSYHCRHREASVQYQPVAYAHGGALAVRAHERLYSKGPGFNRLWIYRQADG